MVGNIGGGWRVGDMARVAHKAGAMNLLRFEVAVRSEFRPPSNY